MLAAQEDHEHDFRIVSGLSTTVRGFVQILNSLVLTAAETDHCHGSFDAPREASRDVVVGAYHEFRVGIVGIEFKDPLMIVACPNGVA